MSPLAKLLRILFLLATATVLILGSVLVTAFLSPGVQRAFWIALLEERAGVRARAERLMVGPGRFEIADLQILGPGYSCRVAQARGEFSWSRLLFHREIRLRRAEVHDLFLETPPPRLPTATGAPDPTPVADAPSPLAALPAGADSSSAPDATDLAVEAVERVEAPAETPVAVNDPAPPDSSPEEASPPPAGESPLDPVARFARPRVTLSLEDIQLNGTWQSRGGPARTFSGRADLSFRPRRHSARLSASWRWPALEESHGPGHLSLIARLDWKTRDGQPHAEAEAEFEVHGLELAHLATLGWNVPPGAVDAPFTVRGDCRADGPDWASWRAGWESSGRIHAGPGSWQWLEWLPPEARAAWQLAEISGPLVGGERGTTLARVLTDLHRTRFREFQAQWNRSPEGAWRLDPCHLRNPRQAWSASLDLREQPGIPPSSWLAQVDLTLSISDREPLAQDLARLGLAVPSADRPGWLIGPSLRLHGPLAHPASNLPDLLRQALVGP